MRASEIALIIKAIDKRTEVLRELATTLTQAQQWEEAKAMISMILDSNEQVEALEKLAATLAQAHQWEEAKAVIGMILDAARGSIMVPKMAKVRKKVKMTSSPIPLRRARVGIWPSRPEAKE